MNAIKGTALVLLSLLLLAVLSVGGYFLHFAVAQDAANRQYGVNTHTQQYQQSLVDKERLYATQVSGLAPGPQRTQLVSTFCAEFDDLTQPPADLVEAHASLCQ